MNDHKSFFVSFWPSTVLLTAQLCSWIYFLLTFYNNLLLENFIDGQK